MYFLEDLDEEDYEIAIKVSYVKFASNLSRVNEIIFELYFLMLIQRFSYYSKIDHIDFIPY